jgi:hypothetical protein
MTAGCRSTAAARRVEGEVVWMPFPALLQRARAASSGHSLQVRRQRQGDGRGVRQARHRLPRCCGCRAANLPPAVSIAQRPIHAFSSTSLPSYGPTAVRSHPSASACVSRHPLALGIDQQQFNMLSIQQRSGASLRAGSRSAACTAPAAGAVRRTQRRRMVASAGFFGAP